MYFAGSIALIIFIFGGLLTLAYKNPKGYSLLQSKIISQYFKVYEVIFYFGAGVHFTLWSNDLITTQDKPYYSISNFSYIWAPLTLALFLYTILHFIGSVTKSIKEAGETNS